MDERIIRRKILTFLLLTLAISSISYYVMFASRRAREIGLLWMWSPGISAILTQLVYRSSLEEFGWKLGPSKYLFISLAIPVAYSVAIYGLAWGLGLAVFQAPSSNLLIGFILGIIPYCVAALGEEIGWRGLLFPDLLKVTGYPKAVIISWIVWSLWHYPAILWADYHSGAPRWFDLASLTVTILGLSALTAWLRLKSGSVWPPVIWHGTHNLLIQGFFLAMTEDTAISQFVVDDFGLGMTIVGIILYVVFLRKGKEAHLEQSNLTTEAG